MLTLGLSILLVFLQTPTTGTIVGTIKAPDRPNAVPNARIALLPPKYVELWNKQLQTRLDNYWELFKPEFATNKEHFLDFERLAQVEAFRYVTSMMRRELGDGAAKLLKEGSPAGQFEITDVPFGSYQLLVQGTVNGREVIWSKTVEVQTEIPIFVDLGKPVS